jgi:hypothetical protein
MRAAPAGAVDYLIRTSTLVDTEFELVYLAVSRLAQGSYPRARAALDGAHDAWTRAVLDEVGDPVVANAIVLLSDGLYAHAALSSDVLGRVTGGAPAADDAADAAGEDLAFRGPRPGDDVDDLLQIIGELVALRRPGRAQQRIED